MFKADNVNLKLNWWALLQGRFVATEISAVRPEVFLSEDSSGAWNFEPLFVDRDFKLILPLPKIVLHEGQIHYYEDVAGKPVLSGTFKLQASFESIGPREKDYFGEVVGQYIEDVQITQLAKKINYRQLLILHDRYDKVLPFANAWKFSTEHPNARLMPLEKVGHYRMLWHQAVLDEVGAELEC